MIAEEIIHKSKNPAKTSPGPAGYDHYDGWKNTLASPHGTTKIKENRITFVQEQEWHGEQSPPAKYPSIDTVSKSFTDRLKIDWTDCNFLCHVLLAYTISKFTRRRVHHALTSKMERGASG